MSMEARRILMDAGLDQTFWGQRIILAECRRFGFDKQDIIYASDWTTCACGEQDDRLHSIHDMQYSSGKRVSSGPYDRQLRALGTRFMYAVMSEHSDAPERAAQYLVEIETRASLLLAEMD